ncbi:MAG: hypothetical protein HOP12_07375 [Candidatus Eisenbacteria bacterium]|uniref:Translocation and assembly module TamB C-terminal domain-containing protein n=1 Tax=Eiseniibacteriota bacterium TaxID=2212470 RepID=A0A849SHD4_UNCEI|nr:hypothetical protein [Candidatus Eisenbacteria bacterium]
MNHDPGSGPKPPPHEADEDLVHRLGHSVEDAVERVDHAVEAVEARVDEAIEGVVEHVPAQARASVRWTVRKLVLLSVAGLSLLLVLGGAGFVYYLWNHTEYASHELTGRVNELLRQRSDLVLELDGLSGNPLSTVTVVRPRVRYREGGGAPVLEAASMKMRYSTWDLLWARRGAIILELERPTLRLTRGPDGKWRIPTWKGAPARGAARGFDFVLELRDGKLVTSDPELNVEGLDVSLSLGTAPTRVAIGSMRWDRGPYGSVLKNLRADVRTDDSLVIQLQQLESPDLAMRGTLRRARKGGVSKVHLDVSRVRWAWLARVFRNDVLDVPGTGAMVMDGEGDEDWSGRLDARASWNELSVTGRGGFHWTRGELELAPLIGESKAGQFNGRVNWNKQRWSVAGQARGADPAHWGAIGVVGWPAGKLNGRFRYAVETGRTHDGVLTAELGASDWTGWRVDSGQVRVHFPKDGPIDFDVRARRREGLMTLIAATTQRGWSGRYGLENFPLDEWPDGRATGIRGVLASGAGEVVGHDGGLEVSGDLSGRATNWLGAQVGRWTLRSVKGRMLPTPDLTADLRLESLFFLGLHFDSLAAPIALGDQRIAFERLAAFAGDSTLALGGGVSWNDAGWSFEATRARFTSPDFDWQVEPPLRFAGDPSGVRFERVIANDSTAHLEASGRWAGPGGAYDWKGRVRNLDLSRLGLPADVALRGHGDVALEIGGVEGDARWILRAAISDPGMQGHVGDSLWLSLAAQPHRLEVADGLLELDGGRVSARGRIAGMTGAWPDSLIPEGVNAWIASASEWNGEATVERFPLERLGALVPALNGSFGRTSGRLELSGAPRAPRFTTALEARDAGWRTLALDGVSLHTRYGGEVLDIERFEMEKDGVRSRVSGQLPLLLAVGRRPEVPERPLSLDVVLPNGNLAVLRELVPQIAMATGRYDVDAKVRGTPKHPDLSGTMRVSDGRVLLAGREELVEKVQARVTLGERTIRVDSLSGIQVNRGRENGRIAGSGVLELDGLALRDYRFDLSMRQFTAVEPGVYAANFDGDFRITQGPLVNGTRLPLVTSNNVEVREAVILFDFTRQTEVEQVEASTMPLYWLYRLQVSAKDNLKWRPADADIEFSADLAVQQTPDSLILFGDMKAIRGTYYFLANRFNVTRADLSFDNVRGIDPTLDAEATTTLSMLGASASSPARHEITVTLSGRSSEPDIQFSATPDDVDDAQILRALTLGDESNPNLGARVGDPLDSYLTRALSRSLSEELGKVFRGYINDIEVSRQSGGLFTGEGDVMVRARAQLNSNVSLRYSQRVPGTERTSGASTTIDPLEREIEAEYRLNRFFTVSSGFTQPRSSATTSSTGRSNFQMSLKARWEY